MHWAFLQKINCIVDKHWNWPVNDAVFVDEFMNSHDALVTEPGSRARPNPFDHGNIVMTMTSLEFDSFG